MEHNEARLRRFYRAPVLWHGAYDVGSVGHASLATVKAYIERQGKGRWPRRKNASAPGSRIPRPAARGRGMRGSRRFNAIHRRANQPRFGAGPEPASPPFPRKAVAAVISGAVLIALIAAAWPSIMNADPDVVGLTSPVAPGDPTDNTHDSDPA